MATSLAEKQPASTPDRRKLWKRTGLAVVVILAALLAWFWTPLNGYADTGAAVGARVACSCRFIGGRSLDDCRKDFEPGMELVMLSEDAKTRTVIASFPLLARQSATYRPGWGCQLQPYGK